MLAAAVVAAAAASASAQPETVSCVQFRQGQQVLRLQVWGADSVLVTAVPAGAAAPPAAYPAALTGGFGAATATSAACAWLVAPQAEELTSGNLKASVVGDDGTLAFTRVSDGALLLQEVVPRAFAPATTTSGPRGQGWYTLDLTLRGGKNSERFYGLGQHKTGSLDNGNRTFEFQPVNTEITVPVLHSSAGYSLLWNLPTLGSVDLRADGTQKWHGAAVPFLSLWVTTTAAPAAGPIPAPQSSKVESHWAERMRKYTDVTGRAPVLGEFMSGYWQSRNRYRNQSEVMAVLAGYKALQLPLSMIIVDYHTWDPAPYGTNRFWPSCWPDPAKMVADATKAGVELMVSPYFNFIGSNASDYRGALARGLLAMDARNGVPAAGIQGTAMFDVFQEQGRKAMMAGVVDAAGSYGAVGVRNWWLDCDEPCQSPGMSTALWGGRHAPMPHNAVGAAYPHLLAQATRAAMPGSSSGGQGAGGGDGGQVMLGRSAWAGTQRYGAAVWSGDTDSSWPALRQQIRAGLNAQMSGITYWTSDIGGYAGGGGGPHGTGFNHDIRSPAYLELLTRWFQYGALCPLFRSHGHRMPELPPIGWPCAAGGSGGYNEVWHFAEPFRSAIIRVMRLRQSMRGYIDALFREASDSGHPIMRMLEYEFPDDPDAIAIGDQYCFGDRYLVKPVVQPNVTSMFVYLPKLARTESWRYVFNHSVVVGGGRSIEVHFALDTFPLFERFKNEGGQSPLK